MTQQVRKLGIDVISEAPWSTHLCQFYQTKEDLLDILVPYFKKGLENNEFCMWITSEPLTAGESKISLSKAVKNLDDSVKKGQIEILDYDQWYTKSGEFEPDKVLQGLVEKENQALKRGFDGLRLAGNTFWLEQKDWRDFKDYEATVDNVIGKYRMIAICSYSLDKCGASEVIDVVANHKFSLIRRSGKWTLIQSAERKRADDALRESEDKYRAIFNNALVGLFRSRTSDGKLLECNDRFAQVVGYDNREACCAEFLASRQYVNPGTRERILETINEAGQIQNFEVRLRRRDGSVIWVRHSSHLNRQKNCIEGVMTDITEEKMALEALTRVRDQLEQRVRERTAELVIANDQLRQEIAERKQTEEALKQSGNQLRLLSSQLITAQEDERKRIALELHDSIGSSLMAVRFGLDDALRQSRNSASGLPTVQSLEAAILMVRQAIQEVRRLQTDLRPSLLDDLGIVTTISWFCVEFEKLYSGIRIEKQISIEENGVPERLKVVIFRVVQEAFNNIAKYANTNLVRISLRRTDREIELAVEDNGVGFDLEHARSGKHSRGGFGLTSMKERTELSGGSFSVQSKEGAGTIIRASWLITE